MASATASPGSSTATHFPVASLRAAGDEHATGPGRDRDAKSDGWTTTRSRGKPEPVSCQMSTGRQVDVRRLVGTVAAEALAIVRRPAAAVAIASRRFVRPEGEPVGITGARDGDNRLRLRLAARSQRRARNRVADSDAKRHMAERNDREQWG